MTDPQRIKRIEATSHDITIEFENGVVVHLASNHNSINLHFSGQDPPSLEVEQGSLIPNTIGTFLCPNDINIRYTPRYIPIG